jgi:amidase
MESILIKDNIDTADKMQTNVGSLANVRKYALKMLLVKKLKNWCGIIGKTNLNEWANFRSTQSCSGWSSRGGQTKTPIYLDHNPCGSSAGSGTAVSANLMRSCYIQKQMVLICPASVNGIVGIKPTVGLVSRSGIIPLFQNQDTADPARTEHMLQYYWV